MFLGSIEVSGKQISTRWADGYGFDRCVNCKRRTVDELDKFRFEVVNTLYVSGMTDLAYVLGRRLWK